jgi:hypothetical protein
MKFWEFAQVKLSPSCYTCVIRLYLFIARVACNIKSAGNLFPRRETVNNNEQHRRDTTYYNSVIRYNLKKTPGYMFRPSLGHPQANTNIIKNIEVYSMGSHFVYINW